jgi:hypothetical protein
MSQKLDESESIEEEIFLSDILEKFIDNIESLDTSLPLIMLVMSSMCSGQPFLATPLEVFQK